MEQGRQETGQAGAWFQKARRMQGCSVKCFFSFCYLLLVTPFFRLLFPLCGIPLRFNSCLPFASQPNDLLTFYPISPTSPIHPSSKYICSPPDYSLAYIQSAHSQRGQTTPGCHGSRCGACAKRQSGRESGTQCG
jgi:hypothetical protein